MKEKKTRINNYVPKKKYRTKFISVENIDYDERAITKNFIYEIEPFQKAEVLLNAIFKASDEDKGKPFVCNYFSMIEEFNIELGIYGSNPPIDSDTA